MMFLQFMMLPVWFVPMFSYVNALPRGEQWAFWCGLIMAFGTLSAPIFGMFADKLMNSEKVLALCNFSVAVFLTSAFFTRNPALLFVELLAVMLFYMPTWALTANIAMTNVSNNEFPRIRIFGSLGWVASGVFSVLGATVFGIKNFDSTHHIFLSGAIVACLGGLLAFFLPQTPPKATGKKLSLADALGLKALVLFKRRDFAVFAILMFLAMIPFQWYNVYSGAYLKEKGFEFVTLTMNLGQVFELLFMLAIPFILRKAGYKWAMVLAMGAMLLRYVSFFCGAKWGFIAGDFGGILIHGLIFGLLIVGSQMYVDIVSPPELRVQAQGLISLVLFGAGTVASNYVFSKLLEKFSLIGGCHDWSVPYLVSAIASALLVFAVAVFFNPANSKNKTSLSNK
jgi:nucleoside transporter